MRLPWDSQSRGAAKPSYDRERSAAPYHSYRWTRLSAAFRAEHPLCAECLKAGSFVPAQVVDHITPWPICGERGFFDRKNLQSLCQDCNIAKGNRDKKRIQEWRKSHPATDKAQ